jgi:hypothetical protein
VRHEHDPRQVVHCAPAGQIDNEIAGLRRHGNACIGVVEADRGRRHATFLQRRAELASYRCLFSGHSLDSEEAHEAVGGSFYVDGHDDPLMWLVSNVPCGACEHRSRRVAWQGS